MIGLPNEYNKKWPLKGMIVMKVLVSQIVKCELNRKKYN